MKGLKGLINIHPFPMKHLESRTEFLNPTEIKKYILSTDVFLHDNNI